LKVPLLLWHPTEVLDTSQQRQISIVILLKMGMLSTHDTFLLLFSLEIGKVIEVGAWAQ
jgi:hypothetical protein